MKITLIVGALTIVALSMLYFLTQPNDALLTETNPLNTPDENTRVRDDRSITDEAQQTDAPAGKLKAANFTGILEKVDVGCFADGECFVEVGGKHITVLMGWSRDTVGSVIGAEGIGGLESHIGQEVEVYAQDNSDGTYTLYGSEGFYVKVK